MPSKVVTTLSPSLASLPSLVSSGSSVLSSLCLAPCLNESVLAGTFKADKHFNFEVQQECDVCLYTKTGTLEHSEASKQTLAY